MKNILNKFPLPVVIIVATIVLCVVSSFVSDTLTNIVAVVGVLAFVGYVGWNIFQKKKGKKDGAPKKG